MKEIYIILNYEVETIGYGPFIMTIEPGYVIPWALGIDDILYYCVEGSQEASFRRCLISEEKRKNCKIFPLGQSQLKFEEIDSLIKDLPTPQEWVKKLGFEWKSEYEISNYKAIIPPPIVEKTKPCIII